MNVDIRSKQRVAIDFCVPLDKGINETCALMHVSYRKECFANRTFRYCHKLFRDGRIETGEMPQSGRPRSSPTEVNINTVAVTIEEDRHYSVKELENLLHIPKTMIYQILKDMLQMRRICSSWVLHFLTGEQLQQRIDCCTENLGIIAEDVDFSKRVIMVKESWIHYHNPPSKCENWIHYHNPLPNAKANIGSVRMSKNFAKCVNRNLLGKCNC